MNLLRFSYSLRLSMWGSLGFQVIKGRHTFKGSERFRPRQNNFFVVSAVQELGTWVAFKKPTVEPNDTIVH